ncbi:hypothetical protein HYV82_01575 [Candidatus Woesearchaeota archaeon]|nr:hypothetical protein [Candidatus Woesearchaeota archaeon]
MASRVVSNTGPFIHLLEVDLASALRAFGEVYVPEEVKNELKRNKITLDAFRGVKILPLQPKFKDVAEILVNKFSLDLGEAQAIALALQEKADYFLTDDLDARTVAGVHGVEAHGTVGIILRAFRNKIIDKEMAIKNVKELYASSSLFITKELTDFVIKSIEDFE